MYSYKYYTTHPPANRQPPKLANADDIRPQFQVSDSLTTDQTGAFSSSLQDVPQFLGCRFWNVGFILQGGAKVAHRSAVGPRKVTRNHYSCRFNVTQPPHLCTLFHFPSLKRLRQMQRRHKHGLRLASRLHPPTVCNLATPR